MSFGDERHEVAAPSAQPLVDAAALRRLEALLVLAMEDFDAGEKYAHHARSPIETALKDVRHLQRERRT